MARTKVMIVDDHPLMRCGLREILSADSDLEVCAEAADIPEAIDLLRKTEPHMAMVDISLPSGSGLDLAKRLLSLHGELRILFISMHDDVYFAQRALRAGALGYINKGQPGDDILEAVRKVARGEIALNKAMADRLVQRGAGMSGPVDEMESLSDRELEVFELIGRGLSTRQIAERLYLSIKTIETHREHLKTKLNLESGAELNRRATLWIATESWEPRSGD